MVLLLVVVAAILPLVVAMMLAAAPVAPARLATFARRHGVQETPASQEVLTAYLSRTRRWRALGFACAYAATLGPMLAQRKVGLEFMPLLAGWLAGALVAEFRFRALADSRGWRPAAGDALPRWLVRVPLVIAALAVVTTLLGAVAPSAQAVSGRIVAWGVGALVCAALVAAATRHVAGGSTAQTDTDDFGPARSAARAASIGAITAVGSALSLLCMVHQLDIVRSGLFGQSAAAIGGVATMLAVGVIAIAWILATSVWQPSSRALLQLTVLCVVLVAGSLTWAGYGLWRDDPPYGPQAIGATATVRLTTFRQFDDDARALGITGLNALLDGPGDQVFVGRVDFTVPAGAQGAGSYYLVVIDRRTNTIAPMLFDREGGGMGGFLYEVPKQFPWLSAMAPVTVGGGWTSPGMAVGSRSDTNGPMVFAGMFHDRKLSSPSDLLIALIFSGPDQQIYWATPITLRS